MLRGKSQHNRAPRRPFQVRVKGETQAADEPPSIDTSIDSSQHSNQSVPTSEVKPTDQKEKAETHSTADDTNQKPDTPSRWNEPVPTSSSAKDKFDYLIEKLSKNEEDETSGKYRHIHVTIPN